MTSAIALSSSTVESTVTSGWPGNLRASASLSEGYISSCFHSPPKSYSVPSASVTVVEPNTATAISWMTSCTVRAESS